MAVSNLVSSSLSASDLITQPGWTLLASTTGNGVTSLTFNSIPQTYRTLRVFWHAYDNTDTGTFRLLLNGNEGTYFSWGAQLAGASWAPTRANSTSGMVLPPSSDNGYPHWGFCDIYNYASTETDKGYRVWSYGRGGANDRFSVIEGMYFGTAAGVTSITLRHQAATAFVTEIPGGFRIYGAK